MAWSDFTAGLFTSGQILTAAQMNTYVRDNLLAGGPIYATEAARNAAITSPFEGQRAYITGSTVAAATGTTTAVPTGVQTIYNGTAWVCVTEIGASSTTVGTTTSTSFVTTLTGDATAISTTLQTGTSALIYLNCASYSTTAGNTHTLTVSVSGATTIAAADGNGVQSNPPSGFYTSLARTFVLTGLTAGTNTFTLNYKVSAGTGGFNTRSLVVKSVA